MIGIVLKLILVLALHFMKIKLNSQFQKLLRNICLILIEMLICLQLIFLS
jgi:hypothetical protein